MRNPSQYLSRVDYMPSPPYQSFPVKQAFENETEIVLARLALPSVPIVMHRIFSRCVPHTHAYSLLDGYRAPRSTADSARRPWPSGGHSSGEIDSTYAPTIASIAGGLLVCFYLIDLIFQYQNSFTITQVSCMCFRLHGSCFFTLHMLTWN